MPKGPSTTQYIGGIVCGRSAFRDGGHNYWVYSLISIFDVPCLDNTIQILNFGTDMIWANSDQLRSYRKADQCLCFHYIDSTIPLLTIYKISNLWPSCVALEPGLCGTWSETPKTGFLTTRRKWLRSLHFSLYSF